MLITLRTLRTLLLALLAVSHAALGQAFPSRTIRLVVPYAPGGAVDAFARPTAQKLSEQVGQPVIVENRPGGNATIAADNIAKSAPDGYSIVLTSINHFITPFFSKNVPYDAIRDFTPVIIVCNAPNIIAVHPSVPVHSIKELIEYAKKNPGKLYYGTTGIGSTHHLGGVLLAQLANIEIEHVPYKGGNPTITDVLSGAIPMAILTASTIMPLAKQGRLRPLGMIEAKRYRAAPEIPTVGETIPGYAVPDTLARRARSRGHAAPDRRSPQRGDPQGDHDARRADEARGPRFRGDGRHPRRIRGAGEGRYRSIPQDRDHRRHQAGIGEAKRNRMASLRPSIATLFAALLAAPLIAFGQAFPSKPIRLTVPLAPGGAVDAFARPTAQRLTELIGQPVVIENRPGASAMIGANHVAKSPPDGYSIVLTSINHYVVPMFTKNVPYDEVKDFTPIIIVCIFPNVIAVHPSLPVQSVKDLVEYAKKNPGKIYYGTTGIGSTQHLAGVLLAQVAGIDIEHVPYKGGNPTITDVLSGALPMAILTASTIMPVARQGRLRALGIVEAKRFRGAPDVPTVGESVPGYAMPDSWLAILGPAGMPRPIVDRLNAEIRKAITTPENARGSSPSGSR